MMGVLVAIGTSGRGILERRGAVAFLTGHETMVTDQRETRQIVIEGDLLPPASLVVTLLAVRAELAAMRIILLMAGYAGRR